MGGYIGAKTGTLVASASDIRGDISATDTTPEIVLKNTTQTDADGGREGTVTFKGEKSGGEEVTLAQIEGSHDDTSDDSRGQLVFKTNNNQLGDNVTQTKMTIDSVGDVDVTSGAPSITITNTTHEDTDGGREGKLKFKGEQSGGEISTLAEIQGSHDGTADDEKGDLIFKTNDGNDGASPTEAMRIDSIGNLNIGSDTNVGYGPLQIGSTSSSPTILQMVGSTSSNNAIHFADGTSGDDRYRGFVQYGHADNALLFGTNAAEVMRLDNLGRLGVGTNSPSTYTGRIVSKISGGASAPTIACVNSTVGGTLRMIDFFQGTSTSRVGSIESTSSSTSYNTSSDHRLKENVTDISDSITRVKQLAPKRFNFIVDADTTVDGFIAHEAQAVVPEAISGTKDELEVWADGDELPDGVSVGDNKLDDDGNTIPLMQGIDQSKLVPLLTAALQEAIAKIETLETKVAALEAE